MSAPLSTSPVAGLLSRPLTRRSLFATALAGAALAVAGCTGSAADDADAVTPAQVDQLAAQVRVQEELVAAYDRAFAASPELAAAAAVLADQARQQLDRLRAAAPGSTAAAGSTARSPVTGSSATGASTTAPVVDAAGARTYLRAQVAAAADAHAAACPDFTGGRAAMLGSISAGLRGQDGQLA
jgi:hypothetical protein